MPSPEASSKRARPKPKPRLKTGPSTSAGAAAPSPPVDLCSSSSATSAHRTPRKQSKTSQTDRDEDSPSWLVGAHISDDIELVETSAQARLRQSQPQSTTGSSPFSQSSSQIGEDGLDALLSERKRKEAEDEDEERLAMEEERWMANARRQPRAPPLPKDVKGKGRASPAGSRQSSQGPKDDQAETVPDDDDDDGNDMYSARIMSRYRRKADTERKWMQATSKAVKVDVSSDSSTSDSDSTPRKKARLNGGQAGSRKKDKEKKNALRKGRMLTPPPAVDEAILQRGDNRVLDALGADINNPLVRGAQRPPAEDEDEDDFDYFGVPAERERARSSAPKEAASSNPKASATVVIDNSDSDDEIVVVSTSSAQFGPSKARATSTSTSILQRDSQTRSTSANAARDPTHNRNPLMLGAPNDVVISLTVKVDPEVAAGGPKVIALFEKPLNIKVQRFRPLRDLIAEAEKAKGYASGSLVITKDGTRVFPSTNPETLLFYATGELVGYRKDVYETFKRKQDAAKQREAFQQAQDALPAGVAASGGDSSPLVHPSGLPPLAGRPAVAPSNGVAGSSSAAGPSAQAAPAPPARPPSSTHAARGNITMFSDDEPAPEASAPTTAQLRITLRDRKGDEIKLMVKSTQTIEAVLNHFGKKMKLEPDAIKLLRAELDGEEFERSMTIGETEIEDGDLVTILGN